MKKYSVNEDSNKETKFIVPEAKFITHGRIEIFCLRRTIDRMTWTPPITRTI